MSTDGTLGPFASAASSAVEFARSQAGVDETIEVHLRRRRDLVVRGGPVSGHSSSVGDSVAIRIAVNTPRGSASGVTTNLSPDGILMCVGDARGGSSVASPSTRSSTRPRHGVTGPDRASFRLGDPWCDDRLPLLDVFTAVEEARNSAMTHSQSPEVLEVVGGHRLTTTILATSATPVRAYQTAFSQLLVRTRGSHAGHESGTAFAVTSAKTPSALDVNRVARDSVLRAAGLGGDAVELTTKSVRFDRFATGQLVEKLSRWLVVGVSPPGVIGTQLLGRGISLLDDPLDPQGPLAAPIDDEGYPTEVLATVEDGRVSRLVGDPHHSGQLRRTNMRWTSTPIPVLSVLGNHKAAVSPEAGFVVHHVRGLPTRPVLDRPLTLELRGTVNGDSGDGTRPGLVRITMSVRDLFLSLSTLDSDFDVLPLATAVKVPAANATW